MVEMEAMEVRYKQIKCSYIFVGCGGDGGRGGSGGNGANAMGPGQSGQNGVFVLCW